MATHLAREVKVRLFRTLFRGREDVFSRRWESLRTGRSGYSPACANEWDSTLCAKKRGSDTTRTASCVDCCQHAFFPVTDEEIEKHLKGFQVMGVYPLLVDETCWFLAVDFDDGAWQEDIASFRETCRSHDVPVAAESGPSPSAGLELLMPSTMLKKRPPRLRGAGGRTRKLRRCSRPF